MLSVKLVQITQGISMRSYRQKRKIDLRRLSSKTRERSRCEDKFSL